ncbi:hypothetical protein OBV_19900 [Oscillibacter valericigenes Sjm18-20]|nr:hypothetical protein OBV_19900 [Oscillibacter valericigenes Sjm18-20]
MRCIMQKIKPPCHPDCPRRSPGCHNPETCRAWRDYCAQKAEYDAIARAARNEENLMYTYQAGILRKSARRRNVQCNGRKL